MQDHLDKGIGALTQALLEKGFHPVEEFDMFVTFSRDDTELKIHAGPDGAFAAFDANDNLLTQGEGPEDLRRALLIGSAATGQRRRTRELV